MAELRRVTRVLRSGRLPARTRLDLAAAEARRRLRDAESHPVRVGPVIVHLSQSDYVVDWKSLSFVLVDDPYRTSYEGAVVLDFGAHKGYYGAYALAKGASLVASYEPEETNVRYLERAAASLRVPAASWHVRPAAVGASAGRADLHVMGASWGHALDPPARFAEYEVGRQAVQVACFGELLAEWRAAAGAGRLVVKLNIEGEECSTVLGTAPEALETIDEIFVEIHPWASCGAQELADHLEAAGLSRRESAHPAVLRMHRPEGARAARRSGPS